MLVCMILSFDDGRGEKKVVKCNVVSQYRFFFPDSVFIELIVENIEREPDLLAV